MKEQVDWKEILNLIIYLIVIGTLTFFIVHYVGQRTVVSGSSMETTLSDGDNLIVDKVSYHFRSPKRFDIIVFPNKLKPESGTYFIKRVIGLPQENIKIDEAGRIYVNGEILSESYGREVMDNPGLASVELHLSETEYFVLGDNRNNSMDSRDGRIGLIERGDITGRAWLRLYPFDKIGVVVHQ